MYVKQFGRKKYYNLAKQIEDNYKGVPGSEKQVLGYEIQNSNTDKLYINSHPITFLSSKLPGCILNSILKNISRLHLKCSPIHSHL